MNTDRRAILQLLAAGRINAAQAERLLAAASVDRESTWVIAGCAVMACLAQLGPAVPEVAHVLKSALVGGLPVLHHGLSLFASFFGGLS
jgi:hypothetical protein